MQKYRNKLASLTLAGAVSFSSLLYAGNLGIPVQEGKWELIGITGLHTLTDASAGGSLTTSYSLSDMDMGTNDIALINDISDNLANGFTNKMTWDANSTTGNHDTTSDPNAVTFTSSTADQGQVFTNSGLAMGTNPSGASADATASVIAMENNSSTHGMADHSILGIQALNHTDSSIDRVAITIDYANNVNYKQYVSPMRTMYVKSDKVASLSGSDPDVKIVYQATMEGQMFKLQFSTDDSFDFSSATGESAKTGDDPIYYGYFSKDYTYDNPAKAGTEIPLLSDFGSSSTGSTGGSSSSTTTYANIYEVFDMNLTDNNCSGTGTSFTGYDPTDSDNAYGGDGNAQCISSGAQGGGTFSMLEGNLTVYEYDAANVEWDYGIYSRTERNIVTVPTQNTITNNQFTVGKGYWVKFDERAGATMPTTADSGAIANGRASIAGFLASNDMTEANYNSDIVKPGWNLIAIEDGDLRYSSTVLALSSTYLDGNNDIYINTNNNEKTFIITDPAADTSPAVCDTFNSAVDSNNTIGNSRANNQINIRCYSGTNNDISYMLFVSDRSFSIDIEAMGTALESNISTVTGTRLPPDANLSATRFPITDEASSATFQRYTSRYGEYFTGIQLNESLFENAAITTGSSVQISIPGFETITTDTETVTVPLTAAMETTPGTSDTNRYTDFEAGVATLVSKSSGIPYGQDIYGTNSNGEGAPAGTVWVISSDGTNNLNNNSYPVGEGNDTILIGMNKRFFVRDYTQVKTYTINSPAKGPNWGVSVYQNGSDNFFTIHDEPADSGNWDVNETNGTAINNTGALGTTTVVPYIVDINTTIGSERNQTIMFLGSMANYFDIREANLTASASSPLLPSTDMDNQTGYPIMNILTDVQNSYAYDTNFTYGAIVDVYSGTDLATATVTASNSNLTFTSPTSSDLTYSPIWAEDFPNNGPLYYLSNVSDGGTGYLKPEIILTAYTHNEFTNDLSSSAIAWRTIDVTRDPVEWFNDANSFDLFQTDTGKGYWVYAADSGVAPNSIVTVGTPSTTLTSYTHFENDVSSSASTVFNHVDGELTVTIGGLIRDNEAGFGQYTSGTSYNVRATQGGATSQLLTTTLVSTATPTADFTMPVNDYETPGLDFTSLSTASIESNISAVDGLGGRNSVTTSIDFFQPTAPTVGSGLSPLVSSTGATNLYIYENNISDITFATSHLLNFTMTAGEVTLDLLSTDFLNAFGFPTAVAPSSVPTTRINTIWSSGIGEPTNDLRYVTTSSDITNVGSATTPVYFSNQTHSTYVPVYAKSHVLSVDATTTTDEDPMRYDLTTAAQTGSNSGVRLTGTGTTGVTVAMSYAPITLASDTNNDGTIDASDVTGTSNSLSGGGTFVLPIGKGDDTLIGTVTYNVGLEGRYFYVYLDDNGATSLYWGIFPDNDTVAVSFSEPFQLMEISAAQTIVK